MWISIKANSVAGCLEGTILAKLWKSQGCVVRNAVSCRGGLCQPPTSPIHGALMEGVQHTGGKRGQNNRPNTVSALNRGSKTIDRCISRHIRAGHVGLVRQHSCGCGAVHLSVGHWSGTLGAPSVGCV